MNIAQVLFTAADRWPERTAVCDLDHPDGTKRVSYSEFSLAVCRVAEYILSLGLTRHDRVALLMTNSYEYMVSFYAIAHAGLVAVPLNVRLLEDELAYMMEDTQARLLIGEETLLMQFPALSEYPKSGLLKVRSTTRDLPGVRWEALFETSRVEKRYPPTPADANDLLSIIYTSGTTGKPKGVMLSHSVWMKVAEHAIEYLRYDYRDEVTLSAAPITHGAGFFILPTIAVGGCNVLISKFDAKRVSYLLDAENVTNLHLVPTMIRLILDNAIQEGPIGTHLKALSYAGATIDQRTLGEALNRFGEVLVQSFGQMEYPMFMSVLSPKEHTWARDNNRDLLLSAGRLVPGAEIKVVDSNGSELPEGVQGEICGRGPLSMLGYWGRPTETAETLRDGWVRTGDLGFVNGDGYLFISGRVKDMIISGGSNVYAREVEDVLVSIDGVAEAAVIGVPHAVWGEAVVAVLVQERNADLTAEAVLEQSRASLPGFRQPKAIVWLDKLPTNPYGKVLKRTLRDLVTEMELSI